MVRPTAAARNATAGAAAEAAVAPVELSLKRKRTADAKSEKKSRKPVDVAASDESSDDDDTLEQSYASRKGQSAAGPSKAATEDVSEEEEEESEEESDVDAALMVHESLLHGTNKTKAAPAPVSESKKGKKVKSSLDKYTPEGESAADRDRRTVFVGNLPVEAAKDKVTVPSIARGCADDRYSTCFADCKHTWYLLLLRQRSSPSDFAQYRSLSLLPRCR